MMSWTRGGITGLLVLTAAGGCSDARRDSDPVGRSVNAVESGTVANAETYGVPRIEEHTTNGWESERVDGRVPCRALHDDQTVSRPAYFSQ